MLQINAAQSQAIYKINWVADSVSNVILNSIINTDNTRYDSVKCIFKVNNTLLHLATLSYLTASVTQISFVDSVCNVNLDLGQSFKWVKLTKGNVSEDVITASGWRENLFYNKTYNHTSYVQKVTKMLQHLEQNGYPFAQIKLDSIQFTNEGLAATLNIDKGDLIKFDTIEIIGDANIKGWFVAKYLGLKKDAIYNELLLKNIDSRLSQLQFVQITRPSLVYFVGAVAKPVVYLTNKQSSSVDGIIGFAPSSDNNNHKLLITGEANLKLQNLFGTGKGFDLAFKSFLNGSQLLNTQILWPYIAKSNIGVDYALSLLKFDSTFLDVKHDIGIQYRLIGTDYVKVFYSLQNTTLLTVDTNAIKVTKALPASNDLRVNLYGIATKISRYDYFLNPRKGYGFEVSAAVGKKQIIKNPTIDAIRFNKIDGSTNSIYDTMSLSSTQYRFTGKGDVFIPIAKRAAIRLEGSFGHIKAPTLFFSELFRLGGIRSLKGFDEQAIFASSFGILNTELRYLLQQNSHVLLFWNGAWYQNTIKNPTITDLPYGFGAGLNFETGAGIFSLYYAVGKQFNNSIEFDKAKVHFGFVNYF
ncbi:MAG: BamA/TamA family outer membrane protein [Bacteroidia bacterium]|nr:BamA/TamA family outer membrane protein [Bacteroidia bacterium]